MSEEALSALISEVYDAALDPSGIEVVERVESGPRGESDPALHRRVRREDDVPIVLPHDAGQLVGQLWAVTVVLHDDAAIFEIVPATSSAS